jgi:tight adherence protein B
MEPSTLILVGLSILWVVFIGVSVVVLRRGQSVAGRLEQVTRGDVIVLDQPKPEDGGRSLVFKSMDAVLQKRGLFENFRRDLARADVKLSVTEYVLAHPLLGGLVFILVAFLRQDVLTGIVVGVLSLAGPTFYLRWRSGQRITKFDSQLADVLNQMVNGLRAGYSVVQAMESTGRELPPPASQEFKRVVQEMQLGVPYDNALDNLTRRMPSGDLDFVVTAMKIQREVGGNLAEILDSISFTIRERVRIKGEIKTLTAQGMITGYVISFLPIGLGVMLWLINPDYMGEMLTNGLCGYLLIAVGLIMIAVGFAVVMKIVDIEV